MVKRASDLPKDARDALHRLAAGKQLESSIHLIAALKLQTLKLARHVNDDVFHLTDRGQLLAELDEL